MLTNTLVQRDRAFAACADDFVAEHGRDPQWATWLIFSDAHHEGPMNGFFASIRDELALRTSADQLWRQYRSRMPKLISCRAEDLAALARVRSHGWRIGIVTNGMTDNQLGKIRNTGLATYVDAWCISDDVGIRKPDPRIFRLAASRCGLRADGGGWLVGDSLPVDVVGGTDAGLRTIWLTEPALARIAVARGRTFVDLAAPDATVTSITEAVNVVLQDE
ncbi:MAG: HAD family hydrolase [Aldersonia sp.]|nr:HAD family hydrolase [Aldersonia sp.]